MKLIGQLTSYQKTYHLLFSTSPVVFILVRRKKFSWKDSSKSESLSSRTNKGLCNTVTVHLHRLIEITQQVSTG